LARKSRKQINIDKPAGNEFVFIPTAAYVRLSVEDRYNKGHSIETQKYIIQNYINENPELILYDTYIDYGLSGQNFDRPAFNKMMSDVENGYVRCIIVKDLSRFGRNYIDAGYYIEKYFPVHGIRFIAITDNYDTANNNYDMMLPLRNILNEAYSIDISRKTKSTVNTYINQGIYLGGRPPFGYKKAPDDKHKMIIDESAAEIVRQIFNWALEGKSISSIVRLLNINKIKSPGSYKYEQDIFKHKDLIGNGQWSVRTVSWILANETYTGTLIQGKTKSGNIYGIHKRQYLDPVEWVKKENAHQAIISHEVFEEVRKVLTRETADIPQKSIEPYTPNLFKGKIFCVHCGGRLDRKKSRNKYTYRCTANYIFPDSCDGNKISENEVIDRDKDI
jgi:DNA invertase Pin-like site-specific DNA recombinase